MQIYRTKSNPAGVSEHAPYSGAGEKQEKWEEKKGEETIKTERCIYLTNMLSISSKCLLPTPNVHAQRLHLERSSAESTASYTGSCALSSKEEGGGDSREVAGGWKDRTHLPSSPPHAHQPCNITLNVCPCVFPEKGEGKGERGKGKGRGKERRKGDSSCPFIWHSKVRNCACALFKQTNKQTPPLISLWDCIYRPRTPFLTIFRSR